MLIRIFFHRSLLVSILDLSFSVWSFVSLPVVSHPFTLFSRFSGSSISRRFFLNCFLPILLSRGKRKRLRRNRRGGSVVYSKKKTNFQNCGYIGPVEPQLMLNFNFFRVFLRGSFFENGLLRKFEKFWFSGEADLGTNFLQ